MLPKPFQGYVFILIALVLNACSSVSVTTDFDHSTQFTQYRTYTLVPSSDPVGLSPSSESALQETLRSSLALHGITENNDNADLHIVRHLSSKDKLVVYPSGAGMPYRYGRYGMWVGAPYYPADVSQYTEGTLILDFVDAKTRKLVFRGIGTSVLSDPATNAARIREAVNKIVQAYPNGAAKGQ